MHHYQVASEQHEVSSFVAPAPAAAASEDGADSFAAAFGERTVCFVAVPDVLAGGSFAVVVPEEVPVFVCSAGAEPSETVEFVFVVDMPLVLLQHYHWYVYSWYLRFVENSFGSSSDFAIEPA